MRFASPFHRLLCTILSLRRGLYKAINLRRIRRTVLPHASGVQPAQQVLKVLALLPRRPLLAVAVVRTDAEHVELLVHGDVLRAPLARRAQPRARGPAELFEVRCAELVRICVGVGVRLGIRGDREGSAPFAQVRLRGSWPMRCLAFRPERPIVAFPAVLCASPTMRACARYQSSQVTYCETDSRPIF